MLSEDVVGALKEMGVGGGKKRMDGSVVVSKARVREWVAKSGVDLTPPVSEQGFVDEWAPEEDGEEG